MLKRAGSLEAGARELPPLDIAHRIERCIAMARLDGGVGFGTDADDAIARDLEALADRVVEIWAPGLDIDGVVRTLIEPARAAEAAARLAGPLREDDRLGWAADVPDAVEARAARAIQRPEIEAVRGRVTREAAEHAAATARVRSLREKRSVLRELAGGGHEEARLLKDAERSAAIEQDELTNAWETLYDAIDDAVATALPPLRIARHALAAAGVLRARLTSWDIVLGPLSPDRQLTAFQRSRSVRPRALLFAALRHLCRAYEATFPGVGALVGLGRTGDPPQPTAATGGPYRAPAAKEETAGGPRGDDLLAAVIQRARAEGLDVHLRTLLAHGALLGAIARSRVRQARAGRLLLQALPSFDPTEDLLGERGMWHRTMAYAMLDAATAAIARARRGLPLLDLREHLVGARVVGHAIWADVAMPDGLVRAWLLGHTETSACLDAARRVFVNAWGDFGDRGALVRDVVARVASSQPGAAPGEWRETRRPPSRHELIAMMAETARRDGLAAIVERAEAAHRAYVDAANRSEQARKAITFWDELNVFWTSEAEAERESQAERRHAMEREGRAAYAALDEVVDRALAVYPPAILFYRIEHARAAAQALRAESYYVPGRPSGRYYGRVLGKDALVTALDRMGTALIHAFGALPSDAEILARHWQRSIAEPEPLVGLEAR